MRRLFPRHAFTVVNNNAAAVLLCLRALSRDRDVLVSRGELVEIGGSFRIPDIMAASGARLREVGTTNRTRLADYEQAAGDRTGLLLKVHTSNFKVVGFTEETSVRELAALAQRAGVPLLVDWGSGDLVDLAGLGIRDELPVDRLLDEGADLVTFSGDKLLGGPQAGFVVGREDLVARVRRDPLARVCRMDRLRLGALHRTLAAYLTGRAFEQVPTLRMLAAEPGEIERRARALREAVARRGVEERWMEVEEGVSRTGGGSSPSGERPTRLLVVSSPSGDAGRIERRLRSGKPPIIARVREGRLMLDLRTVLPEEEAVLAERLAEALRAELAATATD
jgi:L-seryl-tRNA(Ser) seleniumtransferase